MLFSGRVEGTRALPELWVRELDRTGDALKLSDGFVYPGNDIDTWSPLSENAAWSTDNHQVYFVRKHTTRASDHQWWASGSAWIRSLRQTQSWSRARAMSASPTSPSHRMARRSLLPSLTAARTVAVS